MKWKYFHGRIPGLPADTAASTVCYHHEQKYLSRYSNLQKKCCDPLKIHKKKIPKSSLREISLEAAKIFKNSKIDVIPGQKLCPSCRVKFNTLESSESDSVSTSEISQESDKEATSEFAELSKHTLDSTLEDINVSPMKLHSVAHHSRISHGKRKLSQVQEKFKEQHSVIKEQVAKYDTG